MNWKKTLLWVILFTLVIALFEVAFLNGYSGKSEELTETIPKHPIWFLLILHALTLIPCFILGYGKANPIFGFFPPVLLNSVYWYISAQKVKHTLSQLDLTHFPHFHHLVIGTSFLAGFFGIVIVFVTRKMMEMIEEAKMEKEAKKQENRKEEDKQEEVNNINGESADTNTAQPLKTDNKDKENSFDGIKTEKPVIEGNDPLQKNDYSAEKADNIGEESNSSSQKESKTGE